MFLIFGTTKIKWNVGEIKMDTTKWKSVLLPRDLYAEVKTASRIEGRTLSGQLRLIIETWKAQNLSKKDVIMLQEETDAYNKKVLAEQKRREDKKTLDRIDKMLEKG